MTTLPYCGKRRAISDSKPDIFEATYEYVPW